MKKAKKLLIQAYKKEKRGTIKDRIHAVCMVKIRGLGVSEVASLCFCDPHTVTSWVRHFDSEGLAGLEDRPRPGRPPKVGLEKIAGLAARTGSITTPKQLKENIRKEFKVTYHISKRHKDNAQAWPVCQDGPAHPRQQARDQKESGSGSATPKGGFHACKRRVFSQSSLTRPYL